MAYLPAAPSGASIAGVSCGVGHDALFSCQRSPAATRRPPRDPAVRIGQVDCQRAFRMEAFSLPAAVFVVVARSDADARRVIVFRLQRNHMTFRSDLSETRFSAFPGT